MVIERRLQMVFGALAIVLAATFVLQAVNREEQIENRQWVQQARQVIDELAWLRAHVIETDAAVRGYLLNPDRRYPAAIHQIHAETERHLDALRTLIADEPSQLPRLVQLREAIRARREAGRKLMELRDRSEPAAIAAFSTGDAMEANSPVQEVLTALDQQERTTLEQRRQRRLHYSENTWLFTATALVAVVFGLLVTAYVMFRRDAAHRQGFEQALQLKNAELEEASRLKSEFLAHMSHELRTPLNAIIGYTGTLLMRLPGPLNGDQEKQLKTIQNSGRHLLSLINELLDLSRIESGKTKLQLEALLCREIVEQVVSTLRPLAQAKSLELDAKFPDQPVQVATDRRAFSQILINLTNNAIKFTDKGSVRLEVSERNGLAAVDIIDTGVGVQKEDQLKLFQAFQQLRPGMVLREGTGLGLYLSGKLAALIGGRIEFESEFGKGSRFSVLVPKA